MQGARVQKNYYEETEMSREEGMEGGRKEEKGRKEGKEEKLREKHTYTDTQTRQMTDGPGDP